MNISNPNISFLQNNEIFVFGSNEAGIHGAGAARAAYDKFGAVLGQGYGFAGSSFAIPTKDKNIETLPISKIKIYVDKFLIYAAEHTELEFLVTKIGTGLAGLSVEEIAPLFEEAIHAKNIYLPREFHDFLNLSQPLSRFDYYSCDICN